MGRTVAPVLVLSLVLSFGAASPSRGAGDGTPAWVPWTAAGVLVAAGVLYLIHQNAGPAPASHQESARQLVHYIATPEEREELERLTAPLDVQDFLERFFARRDPSPETPANEFREEYVRRYRHANRTYREGQEGWRSDRGRIYILHGRPDEVRRIDVELTATPGLRWKVMEFWEYAAPAGGNPIPRLFRDPAVFEAAMGGFPPAMHRKTFVFASSTEGRSYREIYSTEREEVFDPSIYEVAGPDR